MVPEKLEDWNYALIEQLCQAGHGESDRHDFKLSLQDPNGTTKLCCAFANTWGGFIIYGVKDQNRTGFSIEGLEANKEFAGELRSKIRAEPQIEVVDPKIIQIPNSAKVLYVFQISRSTRRPHLPLEADQRMFWKRVNSACERMSLEEVRNQMLAYEEKIEKLTLLVIDLQHKVQTLIDESKVKDGSYLNVSYDCATINQIIVEAYSLIKDEPQLIAALYGLKKVFEEADLDKQSLLQLMSLSYTSDTKLNASNSYKNRVLTRLQDTKAKVKIVTDILETKFKIKSPFYIEEEIASR